MRDSPAKTRAFPPTGRRSGRSANLWAVAANEGRPEAFTVKTEKDRFPWRSSALRAEAAAGGRKRGAVARAPAASWKPAFSRVSPFPLRTLGAASDAAGGCRVVYQALQWTVNVVQLEGEKVISARRYGDMNPADRARALLAMLPSVASGVLSVALAVVFPAS